MRQLVHKIAHSKTKTWQTKTKSMCEDDDVVSLIKIWNVIQRIIEFDTI